MTYSKKNSGTLFIVHKRSYILLRIAATKLLDNLLGFGPCEDDDGIELGVIEAVDGIGGDVQYCMLPSVHDFSDGAETDDAGRLLPTAVQFCNTPTQVSQCAHLCWT